MENLKDKVLDLHKKDIKICLAITGGGTEIIGELLRHGEASNTIVEAIVPYNQVSVDALIGKQGTYCSEESAENMAWEMREKCCKYGFPRDKCIGIGATCSLKKNGVEREGREHKIFICVAGKTIKNYYYTPNGSSREEEENFAAEKILEAIMAAEVADVK